MMKEAKSLGNELLVIVNNDVQQMIKKGKIIMNEEERVEVVQAIRYVDFVELAIDNDPSIVCTLDSIANRYSDYTIIFANGGDRKSEADIPESEVCRQHNIEMVFGVGGNDKANSSSNINTLLGREN